MNRLSLGIQSLDGDALRMLGREHSAAQAVAALQAARNTFQRVSFDLIYARPGQSLAAWRAELDRALSLCADHLSLYQLTIEPGTASRRCTAGASWCCRTTSLPRSCMSPPPTPAPRMDCCRTKCPILRSPRRKPAQPAYWRYADYAGIGPGAHGRVTLGAELVATRRHRAPEPWADRVERQGHGSTAEERIAPRDRAREMLLMGLRLTEGIDAARFAARAGMALDDALDARVLEQALDAGYVTNGDGRLAATTEGRLRLDALLAQLVN